MPIVLICIIYDDSDCNSSSYSYNRNNNWVIYNDPDEFECDADGDDGGGRCSLMRVSESTSFTEQISMHTFYIQVYKLQIASACQMLCSVTSHLMIIKIPCFQIFTTNPQNDIINSYFHNLDDSRSAADCRTLWFFFSFIFCHCSSLVNAWRGIVIGSMSCLLLFGGMLVGM